MKTMIYVLIAAVCVLYAGCGSGTTEKPAQPQPEKTGTQDIKPEMKLTLDNPADKETLPTEARIVEDTVLPAEETPAAEVKPEKK